MSKIVYDKNSKMPRDEHAMVLVKTKYGTFTLNETAVRVLDVKEGDRLALCQDDKDGADWSLVKMPQGCTLRKNGDGLMFNCKAAGVAMYKSLPDYEATMRFKVMPSGNDGSYPLLTRVNLYKPQKRK
ncbi:MAG: hypothetical protein ACRDDZ_06300 [Marinifilaceae bacterium]